MEEEEGVWGCFWTISGPRACQWRRFGSARCFFVFSEGVSFIFFVTRGGGKGEGMLWEGCKRTTLDRQRPYAGGGGGMWISSCSSSLLP